MKAGDIIEYQERIYAVQRFCSRSFQLVDCFLPIHEDKKHSEYNALVSEQNVTWISPYRKESREKFNSSLKTTVLCRKKKSAQNILHFLRHAWKKHG